MLKMVKGTFFYSVILIGNGWYLPGQMSPWQLESVLEVPRNLPLEFHHNQNRISWDAFKSTYVSWINLILTLVICSRCSQEPISKVSSKLGYLQLKFSWFGQMFPGQMSPWQLESVLAVPRNLHSKIHQNRISNSWVPGQSGIVEYLWWYFIVEYMII